MRLREREREREREVINGCRQLLDTNISDLICHIYSPFYVIRL